MNIITTLFNRRSIQQLSGLSVISMLVLDCSPKQPEKDNTVLNVPTTEIKAENYQTEEYYAGSITGTNNLELRAQVSGYIDRILVDEGSFVSKGQLLFVIQDRPYREIINQAAAAREMAQANLGKAQIEFDRTERLKNANVISDVQLKTAKSELNAARAALNQSYAIEKSALINKGFTHITAPVSGYIGRIPYKVGALVGKEESEPLTVLSDISQVYVYFSMSENSFLSFKRRYSGQSIEEKLKQIPPVALQLPDQSLFSEKGKIELVVGQFDKNTAAISFRASFKNPGGLLRSGNTGRVIIPKQYSQVIKIPQSATFEIQDKTMVYTVGKNHKVKLSPVKIEDKDARNYLISEGLKIGERIVTRGVERLKEGQIIKPIQD